MYLDALNILSAAQAVTVSAPSTNVIDSGAIGDIGFHERFQLLVTVGTAFAGGTSLEVQIQHATDAPFTVPLIADSSGAIPLAKLVAGAQFFIPLPLGCDQRYVRAYYNVVGTMTAGTVSAATVPAVQKSSNYADALTKAFP